MGTEYRDALASLLAEGDEPAETARRIVQNGWAPAASEIAIAELLSEHADAYGYDDDPDMYCACGKWLEWDNYELPDHQHSILTDSGLLDPSWPWPDWKGAYRPTRTLID